MKRGKLSKKKIILLILLLLIPNPSTRELTIEQCYIPILSGGSRVIIVIEANSYVNIRSSRLLPKFKTQRINSWCAA